MSEFLTAREGPLNGTILAHVVSHLEPDGAGLLPGGEELPDEDPGSLNEIRWSPGAWDGMVTHHFNSSPDEGNNAVAISELITRTIRSGFRAEHFDALCELASSEKYISSIVGVLTAVNSSEALTGEGIRELGRRLVRHGRHREPVKLGISLLGLLTDDLDRKLLLTVGRHEEFTLYSAIAISVIEPADSRDQALLTLARSVNGWGRIHALERLADSREPKVHEWMLREGYRNTVMVEYTAGIVATTAGLADALENPAADDQLIDAAIEILSALANGGPVQGMDGYAEAPRALELLIAHVERRTPRLPDSQQSRT